MDAGYTVEVIAGDNRSAKVAVGPLSAGFGITIGNAIRRVSLSYIPGAAITHVKIAGITHEFLSIPGIKEDVLDIMLNLKSVVLAMNGTNKRVTNFKATGPCMVHAAMLFAGDDAIRVIDGATHICTLAEGVQIDMELTCQSGVGYVPAASMREEAQIGTIALDAVFSPVTRVAFNVNDKLSGGARCEQLVIDVETNGAIEPVEVIKNACHILVNQFTTFADQINPNKVVGMVSAEDIDLLCIPFPSEFLLKLDSSDPMLATLSSRAKNCCKENNLTWVGDLIQQKPEDLMRWPNFGRKSLNEVWALVNHLNKVLKEDQRWAQMLPINLGMSVDGWGKHNISELSKKYYSVKGKNIN